MNSKKSSYAAAKGAKFLIQLLVQVLCLYMVVNQIYQNLEDIE